MNQNADEVLIDLLIKQATEGLSDAERLQLDKLESGRHDNSVALAVSAVALIDEKADEPMPAHLRSMIRASAEKYFDEREAESEPKPIVAGIGAESSRTSIMTWLGWAVAAAACLALIANVYITRFSGPAEPTLAEQRQRLIDTTPDITKASFGKGTVPEISDVSGDVVWSDTKQAGYLVLRGLPVNDKSKSTYQLWIFDENQDKETPVDGGIFDVNQNGEVIIPIKATLKVRKPNLFAVTIEKPGGVPLSKRDKIAALGKVET